MSTSLLQRITSSWRKASPFVLSEVASGGTLEQNADKAA